MNFSSPGVCISDDTLYSTPDVQLAVPDLVETATGADILIFVLPHQFIRRVCTQLKDHIKPGAYGISLIKVRGETPND